MGGGTGDQAARLGQAEDIYRAGVPATQPGIRGDGADNGQEAGRCSASPSPLWSRPALQPLLTCSANEPAEQAGEGSRTRAAAAGEGASWGSHTRGCNTPDVGLDCYGVGKSGTLSS